MHQQYSNASFFSIVVDDVLYASKSVRIPCIFSLFCPKMVYDSELSPVENARAIVRQESMRRSQAEDDRVLREREPTTPAEINTHIQRILYARYMTFQYHSG